jgi:hypothetical protein
MNLAYRSPSTDRRAGLLLTVLVHVVLVGGWQMMRTLPRPAPSEDTVRSDVFWVPLTPSRPERRREEAPVPHKEAAAPRAHAGPALPLPALPAVPVVTPAPSPADSAAITPAAPATNADALSRAATPTPSAEEILQRAKRDIGRIDKGLRKENNPYIGAPLDSPQIRMRRKMEEAAALARPGLFEAPKIDDLVNDTGDGARRSRVITGNGTYCITERSPATSIDMIEKHGKQRITSCPQHELPASKQEWRTLRD